MKNKRISLQIILMLTLGLFGCEQTRTSGPEETETVKQEQSNTDQPTPLVIWFDKPTWLSCIRNYWPK